MRKTVLTVTAGVAIGLLFWFATRVPSGAPSGTTSVSSEGAGPETAGTTSTAAPAPLPRFQAAGGPVVPTDQKDPRYDVVKLTGTNSMSLATVFYGEKRDPVWASQREGDLRPLVLRNLELTGVKAELVRVECKHSTCELTFTYPNMQELRQANRALQYGLLGNLFEPGAFGTRGGVPYYTARVAFAPEERDHDNWRHSYQQRRRETLAALRKQGVPADYPPLPAE